MLEQRATNLLANRLKSNASVLLLSTVLQLGMAAIGDGANQQLEH